MRSTVGVFSTVGGYNEYRGGCSVPWGDIMINVGGYHEYRGGYLEYRGGCSVPWGEIMMHVGGYHEYRGGCSVPWGESQLLFEYPTVLNTPTVLMIYPHMHHDIPHGTQISKDGIPPWY